MVKGTEALPRLFTIYTGKQISTSFGQMVRKIPK